MPYIESYPSCPTYLFKSYGSIERIEKFLLDPMGKLPRKVVLQSFGGVNLIESLEKDFTLIHTRNNTDTIDHIEIAEVLACLVCDEGYWDMIIDDLLDWGITKVRNSITEPYATVDTETFCRRVFDYKQENDPQDDLWIFTDEILEKFFRDGEIEDESKQDADSIEKKPSEYKRLGFPTMAFPDIPVHQQPAIIKELYSRLSGYMTCSEENFLFLLLPNCDVKPTFQPNIRWHSSSQQFMRAVFSNLFDKNVLKDNSKKCCYSFFNGNRVVSDIKLNNNLEKISAEDHVDAKRIIDGCYEALGLTRAKDSLNCE